MQAHLTKSGHYTHEKMEELKTYLWEYIMAPTHEETETAKKELFAELHRSDRAYIEGYYVPKESQFCRSHTRKLPNLGCGSTQRNEAFHNRVKEVTHRTQPLSTAVQGIRNLTLKLPRDYENRVNKNRTNLPKNVI